MDETGYKIYRGGKKDKITRQISEQSPVVAPQLSDQAKIGAHDGEATEQDHAV